MTPAAPRFLSAASSDQGRVRTNNEDRVYSDDLRGIFIVIDGMGGHQAGERAADIALERIRARLERQTGSAEQRIREAITLANNAIYQAAQTQPDWKGMACVLTVAVVEDSLVTIGHVGDSRLYTIRGGKIAKITHDHSPVGEREDRKEISEAEAMQHPRRNEVFRDVGSEEHAPYDAEFIEILTTMFEPDGALLLCSDGLSDTIASGEIRAIVEQNAGDRRGAVDSLIAAAKVNAKDNISVILVEGDRFAASFGRARRNAIVTDPVGAETDRLRPAAARARMPWYGGRAAFLVYGLIAASALWLGAQRLKPVPPPVRLPRVIHVAPPESIAAALANAQPGDTISAGAGIYRETIHLRSGVALIAEPPHQAILEGSVQADGVQKATLDGFLIRGAETGIEIASSNVALIRDEVSGTRLGAVVFSGTSGGTMFACSIHDNAGPGIVVKDSAAPVIEDNVIAANGADRGMPAPGLFIEAAAQPKATGNTFSENGAEAIWLARADEAIVKDNFFMPGGRHDRHAKIRVVTDPLHPEHTPERTHGHERVLRLHGGKK
jgi:PPM family protein phosphatase